VDEAAAGATAIPVPADRHVQTDVEGPAVLVVEEVSPLD
jgi:hypothetical protein